MTVEIQCIQLRELSKAVHQHRQQEARLELSGNERLVTMPTVTQMTQCYSNSHWKKTLASVLQCINDKVLYRQRFRSLH